LGKRFKKYKPGFLRQRQLTDGVRSFSLVCVYIKEAVISIKLSNYFLRKLIYLTSVAFYVIKKTLNEQKTNLPDYNTF